MKQIVHCQNFIFLGFFSLVSFTNSSKNSRFQTTSDFVSYNNNDFAITYSKSWQLKSVNRAIAFMTVLENNKDEFQENVNVVVQDLSAQPMNLDEYTQLSKSQIIAAEGSSAIISIKRIFIDKKPADEIIYKMDYEGQKLKIKSVWLINKNKAFILTYTTELNSFDKYLRDADKTIRSFKVK